MRLKTLIDTETLAKALRDPELAIIDCRFALDKPAWGAAEYVARHIPGAVFADMDRDLAGRPTGANGRHPLPDPADLASTLGQFGIGRGVQVVVYDQEGGMYASRLWWLLRWLGHDAAAVLDGGFAKWAAEGRPLASGVERRAPRIFEAVVRRDMVMTAEEVAERAGRADWRVVDARAPERYRGEHETIDPAAGHIPGAVNHSYRSNLRQDGTLLPPSELRARLEETAGAVASDRIVCYCGSGVTACHNLLALEHAGFNGGKLYPGSWSEWCSDPARPVQKGPAISDRQ
jgi:thiosulfate/3-mercaptopyruvate sulfurtransferase